MRGAWLLPFLVAASATCSLVTDLSPLSGVDGSVDAPIEAAPDGFVLTASPGHVTRDPGDNGVDISIGIVRGASFTDIVDVTVNDVGGLSGVLTSPATLTFTGSSPVNLHIDVPKGTTAPQDGAFTLLGIGRATHQTNTVQVGVRVGSVLVDTMTDTSVTVPTYASSLAVKAWGGGGGAGASTNAQGGQGGGGGFASAVFAVAPGSPLAITVGQPGTFATSGGSGGGFTMVTNGQTLLLVAGGGGGGGQGGLDTTCAAVNGGNGLAGGGANAEKNPRSATTGAGGAAGDVNATAGAPYQGGDGAKPCAFKNCNPFTADGGAPGGGRGGVVINCNGSAGGGGGGGYYGGGGGGATTNGANGGGGGSGFVNDAGADVVQSAGSGVTAAGTTDPSYVAGPGNGGVAGTSPANAGRVVVILPKP